MVVNKYLYKLQLNLLLSSIIYIKMETKMYKIASVENGWANYLDFFLMIENVVERVYSINDGPNSCVQKI